MMTVIKKYGWGVGISGIIAIISIFLGSKVPLIGGSIFALFFGMILNTMIKSKDVVEPGLTFVSKKLLRLAIILLGTGLSITQVMEVGKFSLFVMVFTLTAAFLSGYIFGKLFHINWKLSSLISAGTGICGGSAIAALSPIIDSDESDITYAMAATFIFDVLMIILFPIMGKMLNLSELAYGLWTGTAVNDTSSVVAAGYAFSDKAGDFATIVKLTRTTAIIPVALIFSIIAAYKNNKEKSAPTQAKSVNIKKLFPWFILFFVGCAILNTMSFIPSNLQGYLKGVSKFMMAMALGAIGLKTDIKKMLHSGLSPMILGFIVSLVVVVVSISVQFFMGQI